MNITVKDDGRFGDAIVGIGVDLGKSPDETGRAPMVRDIEITPSLLAEEMGWDLRKAQRTMEEIERAHPGVVERRGGRRELVALASRLAPHVRGLRPSPLEREVSRLNQRCSDLEARLDVEVRERREFQRKSNEWYRRLEAKLNARR